MYNIKMKKDKLNKVEHDFEKDYVKEMFDFRETILGNTIVTNAEVKEGYLVDGFKMVRIERELPESYLENDSEERIRSRVKRIGASS